jgi:putative SOS response-associated peptidase YedK
MCGRYTLRSKLNVLLRQFGAETNIQQLPLRYNIAPTQDVPVIRQADAGRELVTMRWGLIPSWSKDPKKGPLLINARADTVAEKPSFRSAFKKRRCLIPADGFYEWKADGRKKQPYLFEVDGGEPFAFAGLWEQWKEIESCVIITTDANELSAQFHDRMPVILAPNDYAEWFDSEEPGKLLTPYPAEEMTATAVNPIVNNARNDVPECVEPI